MRGKEYLAGVRADGGLLVLQTLFFADEVRDPRDQVENLPGRASASTQELRMATQLIGTMSGPWQPADYRDTYTDRVNELIEVRRNNEQITPARKAPQPTNVTSLVDALQASLDAAKTGGSGGKSSQTAGRRSPSAHTGGGRATARKKSSSGSGGGSGDGGGHGSGRAARQRNAARKPAARKGAA